MSKIIILRGPYCSGKTTWSLKYCKKHEGTIRISVKDLIKEITCGKPKTKSLRIINSIYKTTIKESVINDIDLIIDNENSSNTIIENIFRIADSAGKEVFNDKGKAPNVDIIVKTFKTPLEILLKRNKQCLDPKDEQLIVNSFNRFNNKNNTNNT